MKNKRLYLAALILVVICISCNSNTREKHGVKINKKHIKTKQQLVDTIEISNFVIKKIGSADIKLGDSIINVVNAFGKPDSIYNYYYEMEEQNALVYEYDNSKFYFLNNKLDAYEINSSDFHLGHNNSNHFFNIGSNLTALLPIMPNYAANKKDNSTYANFVYNKIYLDISVIVEYDKNEKITTVLIHSL